MSDFICQLLQLCFLKVSFGAIWDFEQLSKDLSTFLDVWVVCGVPSFPAGVSFTPVWKTVSSPVSETFLWSNVIFSECLPPQSGCLSLCPALHQCSVSFTRAGCPFLCFAVSHPFGVSGTFPDCLFSPSLGVSPLSLGVFPCVAGRVPSLPFQLLGLS